MTLPDSFLNTPYNHLFGTYYFEYFKPFLLLLQWGLIYWCLSSLLVQSHLLIRERDAFMCLQTLPDLLSQIILFTWGNKVRKFILHWKGHMECALHTIWNMQKSKPSNVKNNVIKITKSSKHANQQKHNYHSMKKTRTKWNIFFSPTCPCPQRCYWPTKHIPTLWMLQKTSLAKML